MDKKQLNQALKQNRLVNDAALAQLEKDLSQLKTAVAWEDFLVEKKKR